jgi:hypothetical protein
MAKKTATIIQKFVNAKKHRCFVRLKCTTLPPDPMKTLLSALANLRGTSVTVLETVKLNLSFVNVKKHRFFVITTTPLTFNPTSK